MHNRNFTLKLAAVAFMLSACGGTKTVVEAPKPEVPALSQQSVMSVLWMQRSQEAQYAREQAFELAEMLLEENLESGRVERNPAVIVDIDETILDNSPYEARLIKNGETYTEENWLEWVNESSANLVPGASEFLRKAESMGVEVFYISNRSENHMEATMQNLQKYALPFADPEHLLLKSENSDKTARRETVRERYQILLFVGDQMTDFSEEYKRRMEDGAKFEFHERERLEQKFVLIPNPMYGTFESTLYEGEDISDEMKAKARIEALRGKSVR